MSGDPDGTQILPLLYFWPPRSRPRVSRPAALAVLLLAIHSSLLAYSGYVHSPTFNEPGHLAAGISHWQFGRFDLYRVNPPLVRMVAALPPMAFALALIAAVILWLRWRKEPK